MTLSEFSVTIPGWLTLVLAAAHVLVSIEMCRWYLEAADPYPTLFVGGVPFLTEDEVDEEVED